MPDPRVFFAAERTMLAWVRTGLTIMALGFVVARFGLFLTLLAASSGANQAVRHAPHSLWPSGILGTALVFTGSVIILGAFRNHRLYVRSLPPVDVPELAIPWLTSFLSLTVAGVGILLSLYLLIT
jgi:putative membrane protein